MITAFLLLVLSPLLIPFQKYPTGLIKNCFYVLSGRLTWVGFNNSLMVGEAMLPGVKSGILTPSEAYAGISGSSNAMNRLNALYTKDYQVIKDLYLVWKEIGRAHV